mmetsp:Transcript_125966/g.299045  ORF Transcript_125966/g.299045 Transcript_125966/m.299045 type:complete len:106 (+) Transcript_125966:2916-3233(+)
MIWRQPPTTVSRCSCREGGPTNWKASFGSCNSWPLERRLPLEVRREPLLEGSLDPLLDGSFDPLLTLTLEPDLDGSFDPALEVLDSVLESPANSSWSFSRASIAS